MKKQIFTLEATASTTSARAGTITTNHVDVQTPFFMPVGTYGAVKTFSSKGLIT